MLLVEVEVALGDDGNEIVDRSFQRDLCGGVAGLPASQAGMASGP